MATVSRALPQRPHLDVPKDEARVLLDLCRRGDPEALDRIRRRHPKFLRVDDSAALAAAFRLNDAQLVIAREYGFANWAELKHRIAANAPAHALDQAIRADDRDAVVRLIRKDPRLLHVPVVSGNWGPPMSHAANMGRLEIIKALATLGAQDVQHAFDRALLQGQIEAARWLHANGAKLLPGVVMGTCETLNDAGFDFLADLGAPLTNEHGDRLASLAMVLETYARNPAGKHAMLESFARRGYDLPDTPIMAFHRGSIARLQEHVRRDPTLLSRRFALREIYPAELGCANDGRSGMHWTPIAGTTLLHLAIDFEERDIFDWLVAQGMDVNARAAVDGHGVGGHTPLFHTVVCHPRGGTTFIQRLLARGAVTDVRATLRKFLDWCENPRWHEARDVTAAEWAGGFPERMWVNADALRLLQ